MSSRFHTFCVVGIISMITWNVGPQLTINGSTPLSDITHRQFLLAVLALFWVASNFFLFNDNKPARIFLNRFERARFKYLANDFKTALKLIGLGWWQRKNKAHGKNWYIVFGLSNSGKNTLLNSVCRQNNGSKQHTSSELIEYWHFDNAVLVDINSAAFRDQEHHHHNIRIFNHLFNIMKKNNVLPSGIMVTAQLQELSTQPDLYDFESSQIRQNIDHLSKLFPGIPISILATKCDQLVGFSEFFDQMGSEEREQICGIQFPNPPYEKSLPELCDQEFSAILQRFNSRVLWRIQQETHPNTKMLIKDFPVQFELIKPYLGHFLNQVLPSIDVTLNGIFLTSAIQSDRTINHISQPLNEVFALQPVNQRMVRGSEKSFFIQGLFNQFFHAPVNEYTPRAFNWLTYTAALFSFVTIASGAYFYKNYETHANNLYAVNHLLENATHNDSAKSYQVVLSRLYALQQTYNTLKSSHQNLTHEEQEKNAELMKEAQNAFWTVLEQQFFLELSNDVESELSKLLSAEKTNHIALFDTLSTFLMLHESQSFNATHFTRWFNDYWTNHQVSLTEQQLLNSYLKLLMSQPFPQQKINFALMMKAQDTLKSKEPEQLVAELYQKGIFSRSTALIHDNPDVIIDPRFNAVSDLYTKARVANIEQRIQAASQLVASYLWTIDDQSTDAQTIAAHLTEQYYQDYATHWRTIVEHVRFRPSSDFNQYLVNLNNISSRHSPLKTLIEKVQLNTSEIQGNDDFNHMVSATFKDINNLSLHPLLTAVDHLTTNMNAIGNAKNPSATAYARARIRLSHASNQDALTEVFELAKTLPEPFQGWTTAVADDGWRLILGGARGYLNAIWSQFVIPEYNHAIKDKYPVFKTAKNDVRFDDFSHFFSEHGVMETYYQNYLSDFVDEQNGFVWKKLDGRTIEIPTSTLGSFMRAMIIKKMLFTHNTNLPEVAFSMKQTALNPTIKDFTLMIDSQPVKYESKEDTQTSLSWPGPGLTDNRMQFVSSDGKTTKLSFEDDWGWFRVLDLAEIKTTDKTNIIHAIFKFANQTIAQFEIASESIINPFTPEVISEFRCPEIL